MHTIQTAAESTSAVCQEACIIFHAHQSLHCGLLALQKHSCMQIALPTYRAVVFPFTASNRKEIHWQQLARVFSEEQHSNVSNIWFGLPDVCVAMRILCPFLSRKCTAHRKPPANHVVLDAAVGDNVVGAGNACPTYPYPVQVVGVGGCNG